MGHTEYLAQRSKQYTLNERPNTGNYREAEIELDPGWTTLAVVLD